MGYSDDPDAARESRRRNSGTGSGEPAYLQVRRRIEQANARKDERLRALRLAKTQAEAETERAAAPVAAKPRGPAA
ncbi:MAG: hypothetical protein SFV21_15560 [Rhodospirillaceae bacterium]|nr:hypothetical protein [Rhodospirillaceae bacterium]